MTDNIPEEFTGYDIKRHGEDDNAALGQSEIAFCYAAGCGSIHDELDPTPHLKLENQGKWPSCTGNAITTCLETIAGLQAGGWSEIPQLSRKFAWEAGQQLWLGKVNWREGCTIAHVVKSAQQTGVCREEFGPYDFGSKSLSPEAYNDAKNYRVQNQVGIQSADSAHKFLDGGYGAIVIGVNWTQKMSQCGGRMKRSDVDERHRGVGGHAVALVGFNRDGQLLMVNSWGRNWGNNGVAAVDPEAIDYLTGRPYTVFRGVTDLTGFDKTRRLESWGMG